MHSKSDNMEIMINDKVNKVTEEICDSLRNRYQKNLEKEMKDRDLIFDCAHLLCYKCHEINPNCGGLYLDSPNWIKKTKNKQ